LKTSKHTCDKESLLPWNLAKKKLKFLSVYEIVNLKKHFYDIEETITKNESCHKLNA
jgi:hypothetical protein